MILYSTTDEVILNVEVDDNSYRHRAIMGDNTLTLYYSLAEHVELPIGAYCVFQNQRYELVRPSAFKMKHSRLFEYTVTLEAPQAKTKIWKFRNIVDGRLQFSLTAKPHEHLEMVVENLNRRESGWTVGDCIDGVEKLVTYDHDYCWDALTKIASEFETEFEIVDKRISLRKVEYNKSNPLPLSYGRGNGFKPGVGRANYGDTPPIEILYAQGGTENIDPSEYGNKELLLPKSQRIGFDGEKFSDEDGYNAENGRNYVVSDDGLSICRSDKELSSLAEDSLDCANIYPKRVGKVSSVVVVDADKNFYDFIDNTIPAELNYEDYLIEGETMTVIFQSGMLAGREFEVKYIHGAKRNKAARRFEIVPQEIDGVTMPNATFKPAENDTYAVFHCFLPQAYIRNDADKSGASWDMFRQAVKHLFDNEGQKFSFTGELDGIWAKRDWENIGGRIFLGAFVLFSDEHFQQEGALVRITGIKEYINRPHSPELELSNGTVSASLVSEIKSIQAQEVVIEETRRNAIQFTKRRFRDAKETASMLEAAMLENFTQAVSPITVQTMAMLLGDESLQFRFVNGKTNPAAVRHGITYNAATLQLHADAGMIQHLTLGIESISSSHADSEYKYWQLPEYLSAILDDPEKKYYLYAKVRKSAETGVFVLSETAIALEGVSGYYHLLVGVLNAEYDGDRSFVPLYGFTEVLPGRITTDRVVSSDGESFFDLAGNAFHLGNQNGDGFIDWNNLTPNTLTLKNATIQDALKVLNEATIAGFYFSNSLIRSTMMLNASESAMSLDGRNGAITLRSNYTGGAYSLDSGKSTIEINASSGAITVTNSNGVSYISASGVFCNNPKTNGMPASTGYTHYGSIVGLGFGKNVNNSWAFDTESTIVAGVYGRASNTGNAPAYGGFFYNLFAGGLVLKQKYITDSAANSAVTLGEHVTQVVGLVNSGKTGIVYLTSAVVEGKIVFAKEIGAGTMRFYPSSGHKIFDDISENEYYDCPEGYELKFTFGKFVLNGNSISAWFVSRFKF